MPYSFKPSFGTEWRSGFLLIVAWAVGIYFYRNFPDQVPVHWNLRGEVDGYGSAVFGAFFLPALMLAIYVLFLFLPVFDPRRERYGEFSAAYHLLKDAVMLFFLLVLLLTGFAGLGYRVDVGFWLPIMVGALFFVLGLVMRQVKSNWFIGIRTPWTLSSEMIWNKTHRLAARAMPVSGALIAGTSFIGGDTLKIALFLVAILIIALGLPLYSYVLFRQEKKQPLGRRFFYL